MQSIVSHYLWAKRDTHCRTCTCTEEVEKQETCFRLPVANEAATWTPKARGGHMKSRNTSPRRTETTSNLTTFSSVSQKSIFLMGHAKESIFWRRHKEHLFEIPRYLVQKRASFLRLAKESIFSISHAKEHLFKESCKGASLQYLVHKASL